MVCPSCGENSEFFLERQEEERERKKEDFERIYANNLAPLRRKARIKGVIAGAVIGLSIILTPPIVFSVFSEADRVFVTSNPIILIFLLAVFTCLGGLGGGIDPIKRSKEEIRLWRSFNSGKPHNTAIK